MAKTKEKRKGVQPPADDCTIENILKELDFFYGDRNTTMRLLLSQYCSILTELKMDALPGDDICRLWFRYAKINREKAEKEGTLDKHKKSLGFNAVPIIGKTELLPYGGFNKQEAKETEKAQK